VKARAARWVRVLAGLLCGLALLLGGGGRDVAAGPPGRELPSWVDAPDRVYFPETGHHLVDPFLYYWRANGGRAVFGLPISESRAGAGGQSTVQYFERAVLEHRPNVGGATALVLGRDAVTASSVNLRTGPGTQYGKVLVLPRERRVRLVGGPLPDAEGAPWFEIAGSFGTGWSKGEFLERREDAVDIATPLADLGAARAGEPAFRRLAPVVVGALGPDTDDLAVFPSTGHALAPPFKRFWEAHGGAFAFGLPVSEPFSEVSHDDGKPYLCQYFERARMELPAKGIAIEFQDHDVAQSIYFKDPDGVLVELTTYEV
jgi:catechol 2,3-dioxygenase-like lactoylglutathione lyase family enzyme